MSRRFGRNQRRRAREEISRLTEAHQRESQLAAYLSSERRKLEDEIAQAKNRAARLSVIFDPQSIETRQARAGRLQWMVNIAPDLSEIMALGSDAPLTMALRRVPLELLVSSVHPDVMDQALHARVFFSGSEVNYSVSHFALRSLPRQDVAKTLAKEIALPMARLLAEQLKPIRGKETTHGS